jgi:hypothetical protein
VAYGCSGRSSWPAEAWVQRVQQLARTSMGAAGAAAGPHKHGCSGCSSWPAQAWVQRVQRVARVRGCMVGSGAAPTMHPRTRYLARAYGRSGYMHIGQVAARRLRASDYGPVRAWGRRAYGRMPSAAPPRVTPSQGAYRRMGACSTMQLLRARLDVKATMGIWAPSPGWAGDSPECIRGRACDESIKVRACDESSIRGSLSAAISSIAAIGAVGGLHLISSIIIYIYIYTGGASLYIYVYRGEHHYIYIRGGLHLVSSIIIYIYI